MTLIALKQLPNGTKAGTIFDTNEVIGRILVLAGAARLADLPDSPTKAPKPRASYRRRDLRAEDTDS